MPSFDVVSKLDMQEVDNALTNLMREIGQRFDFKNSRTQVEREGSIVTILADDDMKLKQVQELLKAHLTRRKVDAAALDFGKPEAASGNMVRQVVTLREGIDRDLARRLTKEIKASKLKVQVAVQGDELRVSGKKIDDLQAVISHIKGLGIEQPLQYVNFRD